MLTMLESLNYSFRNPKKHNLSNLPHQTVEKLQKNHGVLRGPQLGKQRWRARLGILRVKNYSYALHVSDALYVHHQEHYKQSHFGHGIVQCSPTLTSIQDLFHRNSWQTPVAAVTVYSAPDDGRKWRPKNVEHTCSC